MEYPTIFEECRPRARKAHRCCECGGQIECGESYSRLSGLWDGRWKAYKTCVDCQELRKKIVDSCDHWEDQPALGEMYETVFEDRDLTWIKSFMETRRRRNAGLSHGSWMERVENDLKEQDDANTPKI